MVDLLHKLPKTRQYLCGIIAVIAVSAICFFLSAFLGYKVIALILLFTVSVIALFFDVLPVLTAALLSALIWDYFFIPPKFTLYVSEAEDILMLMMYFIVALVNTVLNYKTRQWKKKAQKRDEERTALKLYNTLLNSLSHELRTPIATIISAIDVMTVDKGVLSELDKNELMIQVSKASLRLNDQVENLLNMSRLESGVIKPVKDWYDMNDLLYDVKNKLKEYSDKKKVTVRISENFPLVKIDVRLIRQSIYNLVHNALVYTPTGSSIVIETSLKDTDLVVTIEDNGKGFPENEIEKVFDKFYRLKNSTAGGTGLGLSVVKGFIEAHQGAILLENSMQGGATFTITIPVEIAPVIITTNE